MAQLKIGIIGFGRMGRLYADECDKSPLWEIAYICDSNEKARSDAAASFPEAVIIDDEDLIFNDAKVDVVGLFTLANARPAQIHKAIQVRKHIIAEKPIAADIETEWQVAQEIEQADLMVAVNMFNRNAWYHKDIIDFVHAGEIGELAIVRVAHMTPGHMPQEGHEYEGPAFHDCGMHYVDVARWYAGSEYATYHAQGVRMWSYPDPWWIQVHGTFANGVVFDITQGFVYGHLSAVQTHNCYVDVIGTKGIARMTHDFKQATIDMRGVTQTIQKTDDFADKKIDVMVDIFARSVLEGKNLGFPIAKDSVIASDIAWKMFDNAVKNGAPCIGSPQDVEDILARRKAMKGGYGLPIY